MSAATLWRHVLRAYAHLGVALQAWAGDGEYERYVRQCAEQRQPPLDRGRYFARCLEEQYNTTARCC